MPLRTVGEERSGGGVLESWWIHRFLSEIALESAERRPSSGVMSARALINNEGGRVHREGEAWQVYPEMLSRRKASPLRAPLRQSRRKKGKKGRGEAGGRGRCPRISEGTNMESYLWVEVGMWCVARTNRVSPSRMSCER